MSATSGLVAALAVLAAWPQEVAAHGWATLRTESGERIESRNSVAWKTGRGSYPNPHGMSQTGSADRPMYCGGVGQHGSQPVHDQISAPEALRRAEEAGFPTKLRKGSKFTLENWITANHGGAAALYYACPADGVSTPEGYKALDWKLLRPITTSYPESKRNGVGFSERMPDWYGWAGGICNWQYDGGVIEQCDDCQLAYGGPETVAQWEAQKPPNGAPHAQDPMIVNIEYQLPADFECEHAVFSWMWQTPHLCLPKEVHEKGAELDFWRACQRDSFPFRVCATEWEGEIFTNCMDAEVTAQATGPAPATSPSSTAAPTPSPSSTAAPSPMPVPPPTSPPSAAPGTSTTSVPNSPISSACVPIGACNGAWCDPEGHAQWCTAKGNVGSCPAPFCREQQQPESRRPAVACVPIGACDGAWCDPEGHAQWCTAEGSTGSCPAPFCQQQQQPEAPMPASAPEPQASPAPVPTPAPPMASTPAPAPAAPSAACGTCSACLWSNGGCYSVDEGYCMAWSTNRWCGTSAGLLQHPQASLGAGPQGALQRKDHVSTVKPHGASGRRSFFGTALVQRATSLARAGLTDEEL